MKNQVQPSRIGSIIFQGILILVSVILIAWGLVSPTGLRAAAANNAWSVTFIHTAYNQGATNIEISSPPTTQAHSGLLLAIRAIQSEHYDRAMQYLAPLITKRDPIALETYAQVLFHQGQYRQAVETWEKLGNLVALEKATWPIYDAGEMDLYLEVWQFLYSQDHEPYASSLAYTLLSRGEYDQAIAILNDARTNFPQSDQFPTWGRYLGDIFKAQERFAESERAYLEVLALDPAETKTWRNLGFLYWELQEYDKALDAFTNMSKLTPDDPYPFLLIAQTYERSGDRDKALEAYRQVLTIDPQNSEAMKAIDLLTQP